ncbi:MAG TPA: hypothetical protein VF421_16770 [Niabella sp.]
MLIKANSANNFYIEQSTNKLTGKEWYWLYGRKIVDRDQEMEYPEQFGVGCIPAGLQIAGQSIAGA